MQCGLARCGIPSGSISRGCDFGVRTKFDGTKRTRYLVNPSEDFMEQEAGA